MSRLKMDQVMMLSIVLILMEIVQAVQQQPLDSVLHNLILRSLMILEMEALVLISLLMQKMGKWMEEVKSLHF